jgi:hypothetical protein
MFQVRGCVPPDGARDGRIDRVAPPIERGRSSSRITVIAIWSRQGTVLLFSQYVPKPIGTAWRQ